MAGAEPGLTFVQRDCSSGDARLCLAWRTRPCRSPATSFLCAMPWVSNLAVMQIAGNFVPLRYALGVKPGRIPPFITGVYVATRAIEPTPASSPPPVEQRVGNGMVHAQRS